MTKEQIEFVATLPDDAKVTWERKYEETTLVVVMPDGQEICVFEDGGRLYDRTFFTKTVVIEPCP